MKIHLHNYPFDYGKAVSTPTAKEGNKTFSLINQSGFVVKKWAIDRDVCKDKNQKRCDYLLLVDKKGLNLYYWVELKGNDNIKACKQILSTLDLIQVEDPSIQEARIISSGINQMALRDITYQKLVKRILQLGGKLKIYTNKGEETI